MISSHLQFAPFSGASAFSYQEFPKITPEAENVTYHGAVKVTTQGIISALDQNFIGTVIIVISKTKTKKTYFNHS